MTINVAGKTKPNARLYNIEELVAGTVVRVYGSKQTHLFMVVQFVDDNSQKYGGKFLVDLQSGDVWDRDQCEHDGLEVVDATIEIHEDKWED